MRNLIVFLLIIMILNILLISCNNSKIIYPYEVKLKEYLALPENKSLKSIDPSDFIFEEIEYKMSVIRNQGKILQDKIYQCEFCVLSSNEKYAVGLRRINDNQDVDFCFYNYETKELSFIYDKILQERKKYGISREAGYYYQTAVFNLIDYYNPYTEKIEDIIQIKEATGDKTVLTCIYIDEGYSWYFSRFASLELSPYFITADFYNELERKAEKAGKSGFFSDYYTKRIKEEFPYYYTGELKDHFNTAGFEDEFYSLKHFEHARIYSLLDSTYEALGYTQQDKREQLKHFGYDGSKTKVYALEISFDFKEEEPKIAIEIIPVYP